MIQIYDLRTVDSLKNAKDLDLPKFWPLGVSRDQKFKMKNSEHRFSSKNNVSKYGPETEKHHSENELKIIHYVQIWPPDVRNDIFFQEKVIFSTKNAKFEKFKKPSHQQTSTMTNKRSKLHLNLYFMKKKVPLLELVRVRYLLAFPWRPCFQKYQIVMKNY